MKIMGAEGMNNQQLAEEIQSGARCVVYSYCISIVILTFRRSSDIYLIRPSENAVVKGLGFSAISLFLGWWGFPWGIIYTIGSFITNFGGGKDVTQDIYHSLYQAPASPYPQENSSYSRPPGGNPW